MRAKEINIALFSHSNGNFVLVKIYTKKGDDGTTGLLGGTRVAKHHARIEAYGNVDELNSWIGLLRDELHDTPHALLLLEVQDRLFTLGSHLALDPEHTGKMSLPELHQDDIARLEGAMDEMDAQLPPMRNFVLPGGHIVVSHCHIARCVCRRSERSVTFLTEQSEVPGIILQYLNRLSDYLFVLSRMVTIEKNAKEMPWKPRG
jgi:cob(I)alamin adenosyltransferase